MDPRQVFVIRSSNHQGSSLTANSRSYLNHFTQPDTIVPDPNNSQDWDRYTYARNNPLRYTDPTGHSVDCALGEQYCKAGKLDVQNRANDLYRSLKNKDGEGGSTLFWRGLNDDDRNILSEGGWDEGGYNDNGGASKADLLHDPLTYLETAVVGSGFIHAGLSLWGVVITGGPAVTSSGGDPAKTVSDIAQQVADSTGGILDPAKGNGWKVTLQGAAEGNNIVARIMVSGGGRLEPYYRVAVQNVGAVTSNGQFSSDQQLTHHLINLINPAETVNNIVNLIQGLIE